MRSVSKGYIKLRFLLFFVILLPQVVVGQLSLTLPNREGSEKMAVFGDAGRGNKQQYELGRLMYQYRQAFRFDTVLMTGDNIYYGDSPADFKEKFEDAYRPLLDQGVKFYASLGNHDSLKQLNYAPFNMDGRPYYRFKVGDVSIYALNSVRLDRPQLDWLIAELAADSTGWKIAFFHHPPYSSGRRHGSEVEVRAALEPIFVSGGVDVVFNGHDHFYERIKPQKGIYYFVAGAGGKIRKGDIRKSSPLTEKGFDADLSFLLVEFDGDEMHFQVIARDGSTVDSGSIVQRPAR